MTYKPPIPLEIPEIRKLCVTFPTVQYLEEKKSFVYEKEFPNFREAFAFLTKVALISEKLDHHAEIWNVYNRVRLVWNTHEIQSLSDRDRAWTEALFG